MGTTHRRRPVVVLTGFLGAGKTTVLNGLLAEAATVGRRIGVVENEFGETAVDGGLLLGAASVVEVTGGCACCTVRGGLVMALELLAERSAGLDAVVVELSGVADPVPVVQALQVPAVRRAFVPAGIVCVVDAAAVHEDPPHGPTGHLWRRQLRYADRVALTKLEAVPEAAVPSVERRVREHAPTAVLQHAPHGRAALDDLLAPGPPAVADPPGATEVDTHDHADDEPGHGFDTLGLATGRPLDLTALRAWLVGVALTAGVVRAKGVVRVGRPGRRVLVQAVGPRVTVQEARPATDGARADRLVLIGRGLDPPSLRRGFCACAVAADGAVPAGPSRT